MRTNFPSLDENGDMGGELWLVIGVQGAGKSTIADLLAHEFDRAVHIRGGAFYRWAARGWVHHDDDQVAEARRFLDLRYRLSRMVADEYCTEGFVSVVQDNIYGEDVTTWLTSVNARPRHLVVLRPSTAVVRRRDEVRRLTTGKVAYRETGDSIEDLDAALGATANLGLWLDSSDQTPEETVAEILRRRSEAALDDVI